MMLTEKKGHPEEKSGLHPRSKHRQRYNFKLLVETCPELSQFVVVNEFKDESIDFSNPKAVKVLNKSLLMHFYGLVNWDIPENYLCPPIPGRADYIHHIAELLGLKNESTISGKSHVKCLDIGVGANCVYPIIGIKEYGWSFVGSDIDPIAIASANKILELNPNLQGKLELRFQANPKDIYNGIIRSYENFDLSICNPPFHSSLKEAQAGTLRKLSNLNKKIISKAVLNFGGQNNELRCEGGELGFIQTMIRQSKQFSTSCFWFSTLVSKESNLKRIYQTLKMAETNEIQTIEMGQGNKKSRIVAWTYNQKRTKP